MAFYSHPNRPLFDHVLDVSTRIQAMLERMPVQDEVRGEWSQLLLHLASCHDFGKYTTLFQRHLAGDSSVGEESYHSLLGALFGSYAWNGKKTETPVTWHEISFYSSLIVHYLILQHHGHLRNFQEVVPNKARYLQVQMNDLRKSEGDIELDLREHFPEISMYLRPFLDKLDNHFLELTKIHRASTRYFNGLSTFDVTLALKVQMAFSCLIDADKHSAANNRSVAPIALRAGLVESYRKRKFTVASSSDPIVIKRNKVKDIICENVFKLDRSQHFHTFTAPTGTGKTLAALEGALLLREQLSADGVPPRRIIYVLPFTSIIDQNYEVIEQVISPDKADHRRVLKHHYMSDIAYRRGDEEGQDETPLDRQLMLVESWESEVIVTTYVQLMHTMLGNRNRQLKKLHNLAGAIVILDEVQNMPFAYWSLTEHLCKAYSEQFDNKWILLTATQPHIFPKSETTEWLENSVYSNQSFFEDMNRTEIILPVQTYLAMEEWLETARAYVNKAPSTLIIVNTIVTSIAIYEYFCGMSEDETVYYLSANMIFEHRKRVLDVVKNRLDAGEPVILVSTQVVEAGVDVDFQCVIRDLGPMDSIIQAAGRCNRHGKRSSREPVIILPLRKEGASKADSALVYKLDAGIAWETMLAFHTEFEGGAIPESAYQRMVEVYYQKLKNRKQDSESWTHLKQLQRLEFEELSSFSLIPQKGMTVSVFIQYNDEAEEIWNYYVNQVCKEKDEGKRREHYLLCKSKLRQYQLDVSERHVRIRNLQYGFVLIHREWVEANQYYSRDTGWVRDVQEESAFIW